MERLKQLNESPSKQNPNPRRLMVLKWIAENRRLQLTSNSVVGKQNLHILPLAVFLTNKWLRLETPWLQHVLWPKAEKPQSASPTFGRQLVQAKLFSIEFTGGVEVSKFIPLVLQ